MNRSVAHLSVALALALAAPAAAQEPEPTPSPTPVATATPIPAPANDTREGAAALALGGLVRGDTTGSTLDANEPPATCTYEGASGSVWYALPKATTARDLVIEVDAGGALDAVVDVVRRERSQLSSAVCGRTDRAGRVTLDFTQEPDAELYVRVSPVANSEPGPFTVRAVVPDAPEPPPGRALPAQGATGSLDRVANPDDAYAVSLAAGRTYRLRLVSGRGCVGAGLYRPGAKRFGPGNLVKGLSCDDYVVFTPGPGEGGRYAIQLLAPRTRRGALPYRLDVRAAGRDDATPGLELAEDRATSGSLRGSGADVVDLYRFTVARRSILDLSLETKAAFDLRLVGQGGKRLACACDGSGALRRTVKRGTYFVAVRSRDTADGGYVLRRLTRTITRLRLSAPGRIAPDARLPLTARVRPDARGPMRYDLERFDPLAGWQFVRRTRTRMTGGVDTTEVEPLVVGRYRVTAAYLGTRVFAPAAPKTVVFDVADPQD